MRKKFFVFLAPVMLLLLAGCITPGVTVGGSDTGPASGTAGKSGSQSATQLARCDRPRATILLDLSRGESQREILLANELPPDPLPAMRLIAQQTGCFRIVHRTAAIQRERELQRSGETATTQFAKGKMVAADYTVLVEIILSNRNKSGAGAGAAAGSLFGPMGVLIGALAGSVRTSEAGVVLTLVDNRTSLQEASASGSASGASFALSGLLGVGSGGVAALGGAGGYENTAQGKVVMGAMVDAMNKLIPNVPDESRATPASLTVPAPQPTDDDSALVRDVQEALGARGYSIVADGVYGGNTKAAISDYQKKHGLLVDGKPSQELLSYIRQNK